MQDERIQELYRRHEELEQRLADPAVLGDPDTLREVAQEHAELEPVVGAARRLEEMRSQLEQAREMVRTSDDREMVELARAEVGTLEPEEERLSEQVRQMMMPKDPLADRAAVVEVRAGTGGDEAALFAGDLVRMYTRYAERRGWTVELVDMSEGEVGGYREAVFAVRGENAYGDLRHESGVHRVQRVPETENQGRIHTSAATVAVLPEAEEVDVEIRNEDLRIDVFRSSGPGGQSVNTTDSAVRITHVPSGVVVSCQDEKSQHKNKAKAMRVLRSRLLDMRLAEQEAERARERKLQVGTGDRSAKIRTYNFPQGRVTDHRINLTLYRLPDILGGDLDEVIDPLKMARQEELLEESSATA